MITINPDQIRKILIRGVNWIGDAVLTTPTLAAARGCFPAAKIYLLAKRPVAELLGMDPNIDRIMLYDAQGRHKGKLGRLKLAEEIKREGFDAAILLQNAFEAALIVYLAAIPIRYGYGTDGRGSLLNLQAPCPEDLLRCHQVNYYLNLIRLIDGKEHKRDPFLWISGEEEIWADGFLRNSGYLEGPVIGINPGATYGSAKRWPAEKFARLSDILIERHNARIIIFGGPGEEETGLTIAGLMKGMPLVLSGKTKIRELMALIKRCGLFITNDSGPMHIAAAFGVPVVAVFGPTDHRTTSPYGDGHIIIKKEVKCAPCLLRECPTDHECMESIMVEEVFNAADRQIRRKKSCDTSMSDRDTRDDKKNPPSPPFVKGGMGGFSDERRRKIAVFIDRDGTINKESGYIDSPDKIDLIPGSAKAIRMINNLGLDAVVVTNQSGIGRSCFTDESLNETHKRLKEILNKEGAYIDAVYYCPHHPDDRCECRKPMPGLLKKASTELYIDLCSSYVVGDKISDLVLARNAGAKAILVKTGYGQRELETLNEDNPPLSPFNKGGMGGLSGEKKIEPDFVAEDLLGAVKWIEKDIKRY